MEHATTQALSEGIEVMADVRDAIQALTAELKLNRLAITAIHATLQDVCDQGVNENFPGYIRVKDISERA
jgi:hypothetical protein